MQLYTAHCTLSRIVNTHFDTPAEAYRCSLNIELKILERLSLSTARDKSKPDSRSAEVWRNSSGSRIMLSMFLVGLRPRKSKA